MIMHEIPDTKAARRVGLPPDFVTARHVQLAANRLKQMATRAKQFNCPFASVFQRDAKMATELSKAMTIWEDIAESCTVQQIIAADNYVERIHVYQRRTVDYLRICTHVVTPDIAK